GELAGREVVRGGGQAGPGCDDLGAALGQAPAGGGERARGWARALDTAREAAAVGAVRRRAHRARVEVAPLVDQRVAVVVLGVADLGRGGRARPLIVDDAVAVIVHPVGWAGFDAGRARRERIAGRGVDPRR